MLPVEIIQKSQAIESIGFFPFSEGAVLFRRGTRKIWALNHVAAVIWSLAVERATVDEISTRISAAYGISQRQALQDTESVLHTIEAENLLGDRDEDSATEVEGASFLNESCSLRLNCQQELNEFYFHTPGHLIQFCSGNQKAATEYIEALKAFRVLLADRKPDTRIHLLSVGVPGSTRYKVYINTRCVAKDLREDDVVPALLGATFSRIADFLTEKLLFHAAVLEKKGRAFLFPGDAGSGKTTLVATLARCGYNFFADELALIDPQSGCVTPLPLPMSIKAGSVPVLSGLYPELDQLTVYTRADGKDVKILSPILDSKFNQNQHAWPAAIIFPRYDSSTPAKTTSLSKSETISRLVRLCSSSRQLVDSDIEAMIRLVDGNPCFEVVYKEIITVHELLEHI